MVLAGSIWVSFWDKIDHRIIKSTFPYLNEPIFIKTINSVKINLLTLLDSINYTAIHKHEVFLIYLIHIHILTINLIRININ
jgi:hypothetical protein